MGFFRWFWNVITAIDHSRVWVIICTLTNFRSSYLIMLNWMWLKLFLSGVGELWDSRELQLRMMMRLVSSVRGVEPSYHNIVYTVSGLQFISAIMKAAPMTKLFCNYRLLNMIRSVFVAMACESNLWVVGDNSVVAWQVHQPEAACCVGNSWWVFSKTEITSGPRGSDNGHS